MVVFTCNNCGESLQKPKVEKHFTFSCKGQKNLTCVDCFKDFRGDEYSSHIKCITENQRYGSKDYVEKAKKGEVKQESWMEMIKSILMHESNMSVGCKNLLNTISSFNNVPRKKPKFINFMKSSMVGKTSLTDIEGVWDLIEKYKTAKAKENNLVNEGKSKCGNGSPSDANEPKKKKRKSNEGKVPIEEDLQNGTSDFGGEKPNGLTGNDSFCLIKEIETIVAEKGPIARGKLEKRALKKYKSLYGEDINVDKFNKKFNKKLNKSKLIVLDNGIIKLKTE